jgi:hypothetical protein
MVGSAQPLMILFHFRAKTLKRKRKIRQDLQDGQDFFAFREERLKA